MTVDEMKVLLENELTNFNEKCKTSRAGDVFANPKLIVAKPLVLHNVEKNGDGWNVYISGAKMVEPKKMVMKNNDVVDFVAFTMLSYISCI